MARRSKDRDGLTPEGKAMVEGGGEALLGRLAAVLEGQQRAVLEGMPAEIRAALDRGVDPSQALRELWPVLEARLTAEGLITDDDSRTAARTQWEYLAHGLLAASSQDLGAAMSKVEKQTREVAALAKERGLTLEEVMEEVLRALSKPGRGGPRRQLPAFLKFPADRVHQGTVQGIGRVEEWQPIADWVRAILVAEAPDYRQLVGFRTDPGEGLWEWLRTRGEAAIKLHYVFWARCFEATGGDPNEYFTIDVAQLCEDLGYKRHHKGGFRLRDKQEAMLLVETFTAAELGVVFKLPNGKSGRLHGRIWERGITAETRDEYSDVFGASRAEDAKEHWEPAKISVHPGQWFQDAEWRRANAYMGLLGQGLLRLDNRTDKWALRIGGYYGSIARTGQYRHRAISVGTVLARTGLAERNARNPREQLEAFERAHERLVQVGVLKAWQFATSPIDEEPDMDDPETVAQLAEYGSGDWRRKRVQLQWPDELTERGTGLAQARQRAIGHKIRERERITEG